AAAASLADVALGRLVAAAVDLAGNEDDALELRDEDAVLVVRARVHLDGPAIGLRARLLRLEYLGLDEQRVAVEHGGGMAELFGREVRDRLAADIRHGHP